MLTDTTDERWKKQKQAKKLRASANIPHAALSSSSSPQQAPTVRRGGLDIRQEQMTTNFPQTAIVPMPPFGFDPWNADQSFQIGHPSAAARPSFNISARPSLTSTPSTSSSALEDPFSALLLPSPDLETSLGEDIDALAGPGSPLLHELIAYAYELSIPESWPAEANTISGAYEIARSWDDVVAISQDSCFANAYLALLAGTKAGQEDDEQMMYHSRVFQGQALTDLRQRVARKGPQDVMTMKAILKLFCSEIITDNTSVARVHLKTLRNLVTAAGGVILLDSWLREDLLCCDSYFALKYGTRPLIPASQWTPGSLSQPWKARLAAAGIFGDHSATVDPLIEHPTLKSVMTDLRELLKVQEYILDNEIPAEDQLLRWRQLRRFDCISRLADHHLSLTIYPHLYDNPKIQAGTTIAIALLQHLVLGCPESVRFGLRLLERLRETLEEIEGAEEPEGIERLRLWALYIGSLAERVHPMPPSSQDWFRSQMREVGAGLRIQNWDDMKAILKHFLFSERLQHEIAGGRLYRTIDFRQGLYSICNTSWRLPGQEPIVQGEGGQEQGKGKQRAPSG